jgi:hypothetical protein
VWRYPFKKDPLPTNSCDKAHFSPTHSQQNSHHFTHHIITQQPKLFTLGAGAQNTTAFIIVACTIAIL